jgi:hypothetical protein
MLDGRRSEIKAEEPSRATGDIRGVGYPASMSLTTLPRFNSSSDHTKDNRRPTNSH